MTCRRERSISTTNDRTRAAAEDRRPSRKPRRGAGRRSSAEPKRLPQTTIRKNWYIIHTYSGFEHKVAESLRSRAEAFGFADKIGQILIPDRRSGRAAQRQEGHQQAPALSRLRAGPDGNERRAVARREEHAARHRLRRRRQHAGAADGRRSELRFCTARQSSAERPRPKITFEKNETVRIVDGPFANFTGKVDEVNTERNTLRVLVTIFGRATPVELEFLQVRKELTYGKESYCTGKAANSGRQGHSRRRRSAPRSVRRASTSWSSARRSTRRRRPRIRKA